MSKEWRPFPYSPVLHRRVAFLSLSNTSDLATSSILWAARECSAIEAAAEVCGQAVLVGQEPSLHALDHQVGMFVRCIMRPVPTVARLQVKPRSVAIRDRTFTVDEQDDELLFFACTQRSKAFLLPPQAMTPGILPAKFAFSRKELKPARHRARNSRPSPPPSTYTLTFTSDSLPAPRRSRARRADTSRANGKAHPCRGA